MSATRDKDQKVAFIYSNFYEIYKKEKKDPSDRTVSRTVGKLGESKFIAPVQALSSGRVLKVDDLRNNTAPAKVENYTPVELIGKNRTLRAESQAVSSLKDNLKKLTDLHSRLRFMLRELEDLVKD